MPTRPCDLTICAVIAARNEAPYLRALLPILDEQHIDVVILDNGSSDESRELIRARKNAPVIGVRELPFTGSFSLSDQLRAKREVFSRLSHDWVVHQDADEILEHHEPEKNLRDAIEEADADGCNVMNFEEFVFLPHPGKDHTCTNYHMEILRYYHFKPSINRLNRAWKRTADVAYGKSGGHRLEGNGMRLSRPDHILKHYIVLSQGHANAKYLERIYSDEDISRGWHTNRLGLSPEDLRLPDRHDLISELPDANSRNFDRSRVTDKHYWQWEK